MADISQIKLPDNTTYDINAKKVNSHTVATDVPSGAVFTDTKNTAGSTDTSSKIYLIGATSQAANPQTYSDDQVYVEDGKITSNSVESKSVIIKNSTDKSIIQLGRNAEAGSWLVNDANGGYSIWGAGSTGSFNAQIISTMENVSGSWKKRVRNESDTTDHYGRTIWYEGNNVERVVVRANDDAVNILNTSGSARVNLGIDSYDHGTFSLYDENNSSNVYAYGSGEVYAHTYLAMDSDENITAKMEGTEGKITLYDSNNDPSITLEGANSIIECRQMSTENNTVTFSKSSGSWSFSSGQYTKSGQVVQLRLAFKGGSSNVSVGSNSIVGTVNVPYLPNYTIRLCGYYSGTMLMGELTSSGGFNVRILGQALNLASSNVATLSGTYIVEPSFVY